MVMTVRDLETSAWCVCTYAEVSGHYNVVYGYGEVPSSAPVLTTELKWPAWLRHGQLVELIKEGLEARIRMDQENKIAYSKHYFGEEWQPDHIGSEIPITSKLVQCSHCGCAVVDENWAIAAHSNHHAELDNMKNTINVLVDIQARPRR